MRHVVQLMEREELTDSDNDESGSSSDEEDDGEDDIDWYDAHILSYKLDTQRWTTYIYCPFSRG